MPPAFMAPGLRVAGNRFNLALTLRPELNWNRIRLYALIFAGCLVFLYRIGAEVVGLYTPATEGIGWRDLVLLSLGLAFVGRALFRELGREVTVEITPHELRYRESAFGFGGFHRYNLAKLRRIRFVQGGWNTHGPPPSLAFDYGDPATAVSMCQGLEDGDLYRLFDEIRRFRPDLCEPIPTGERDRANESPTTIGRS